MKMVLSSRLAGTRFVALLTLGLSAVVVGATPPPASAQVYMNPAANPLFGIGFGGTEITQVALVKANKHSVEGRLYTYQQARLILVERVEAQNKAYATYQTLAQMTDDQAADAFPSGDYGFARDSAARAYNAFQQEAEMALVISDQAFAALSDGQQLSDIAMVKLHGMLGF